MVAITIITDTLLAKVITVLTIVLLVLVVLLILLPVLQLTLQQNFLAIPLLLLAVFPL